MSGRGDDYPPPDDAKPVYERLLLGNVEVFEIGVRHAYLVLSPVVAKRLQVSVVVVVTVFLEMDHRPFLLQFLVHGDKVNENVAEIKNLHSKTCVY